LWVVKPDLVPESPPTDRGMSGLPRARNCDGVRWCDGPIGT
jgi:hypothetical protein